MDTNDIRLALERLLAFAQRSQDADWPSAIERDLMLAELRNLYSALLYAAPNVSVGPAAANAGECAPRTAAAVAMVQTDAVAADADAGPLGSADDFDTPPQTETASVEQPASEPAEKPMEESGEESAEEPVVEAVAAAPADSEPEKPVAEEPSAAPQKPEEYTAGESEQKNLLFDLGAVQHRTHRRMLSLYDDEAFDRLPNAAAPAPAPAPAPASAPAPEPAPAPEAQPESKQESEVAPESESAVVIESVGESAEYEPAEMPAEAVSATETPADDYVSADLDTAGSEDEEVVWTDSEPDDADSGEFMPEPAGDDATEPEQPLDSDSGPETDLGEEDFEFDDDFDIESAPITQYTPDPEFTPESERRMTSGPAAQTRTVEDVYISAAESAKPAPTVLGDVMNSDVEVLGDRMAPQASLGDTLAHAPVTGGLTSALDISERYQIIAELFGGDADACDAALAELDAMESLEDAVIYIEENFRWNPASPATALVMDLLDRKFS